MSARIVYVGMGLVMACSLVIAGTRTGEVAMTQWQVPASEVSRACQGLGIRDWSKLQEITVSMDEAKAIQAAVGDEAGQLSTEDFQ